MPRLLLYFAALMFLTGCADRLLLYPSTDYIDPAGATRREITTPKGTLEIWTARSAIARTIEPKAYVLEFTGNATRAEAVASYDAALWNPRAVEVWAVNYPGYGRSAGRASLASIPPAALAAYDALAKHADGKPIYLSGTSLGTAAALYVAANRPAAGLLLRNPPPIRQIILNRYGWWNLWLFAYPLSLSIPRELDSLANAAKIQAPAIFLLADRDEVVPPPYQQKVLNAYAGPKQAITLRYANHNTPLDDEALRDLAAGLNWLTTTK